MGFAPTRSLGSSFVTYCSLTSRERYLRKPQPFVVLAELVASDNTPVMRLFPQFGTFELGGYGGGSVVGSS
jgi:hypothetical protein